MAHIQAALGATTVNPDLRHLAAAHQHGLGLVTNDHQLFSRALRTNLGDVRYRAFEGNDARRLTEIIEARRIARIHSAENTLTHTSSPIGRTP